MAEFPVDRRTLLSIAATGFLGSVSGCVSQPSGQPEPGEPDDADADRPGPEIGFSEMAAEVGLEYEPTVHYQGINEMKGNGGVYVVDYDNDGREELLCIGGEEPLMYAFEDGEFQPIDAFPAIDLTVKSVLFFDWNNDGWEDLLVMAHDAEPVFFENEEGTYTQRAVGFDRELSIPVGATAGDFTGNGFLDVFIYQNGDWVGGRPAGEQTHVLDDGEDNGKPNVLYRNDGDSFTDVTEEAGIEGDKWSLAASFADLTGNGAVDIHVANDFNHDMLYENNEDGTFTRRRLPDETNRNGMASTLFDRDNNGHLDIFVTNIFFPEAIHDRMASTLDVRSEGNNLLINQGDGTFRDEAPDLRVNYGGWGWAAVAEDLNNDGRTDLFHATQEVSFNIFLDQRFSAQDEAALQADHPYYRRPVIFRGTDGDRFQRQNAAETGFEEADGRGVVSADFSGDGQLDLVVANADGPYQYYRNETDPRRALQLKLVPTETTVHGSRVRVETSQRVQHARHHAKTDFLSQSSRIMHFGLNDAEEATVEIEWPNGDTNTFEDVQANRRLTVSPGGIEAEEPFTND